MEKTRSCPDCGGKMKEVANLKAGPGRNNIHRFKCTDCGLEESATISKEAERLWEEDLCKKEKKSRNNPLNT